MKIRFNLNFEDVEIDTDPLKRLLDVLREDFNLSSVKEGCGEGECGACSVLINNKITPSCMFPVGKAEGKNIITVDGLKKTRKYEIIRRAFEDAGAVQCGFCIPGMTIATEALLLKNPNPSIDEIKEGISGNLCRCTGYNMIIDAIKIAAERGKGLW
ncbi:MAG: (2Fe-2S)-binding protein [Clostridiaceae bacterium]